jgi:hypothetical protein
MVNDILDIQIGGDHYRKYKIQPIEYCQGNELNCCESNIVKYATRHRDKGGRVDVEKIIHYAQIILEMEYTDTDEPSEVPPNPYGTYNRT